MNFHKELEILEIIDLKQQAPEYHPIIETLKPDATTQLHCDIDLALLDERHLESPERVKQKVIIINKALVDLSLSTGHQIQFSLLTQKPNLVFQHPDTKTIYSPLLKIESIRHGLTNDKKPCLVTTPLAHVGCEFGVITSVKDKATKRIKSFVFEDLT